jgi:hypothetical protein
MTLPFSEDDFDSIHLVTRVGHTQLSESADIHLSADFLNSALSHTVLVDMAELHNAYVLLDQDVSQVNPGTRIQVVVRGLTGETDRFYVFRGIDRQPQGALSTWYTGAGWVTASLPTEEGNVGLVAAAAYQGSLQASVADIVVTESGYVIRGHGFELETM